MIHSRTTSLLGQLPLAAAGFVLGLLLVPAACESTASARSVQERGAGAPELEEIDWDGVLAPFDDVASANAIDASRDEANWDEIFAGADPASAEVTERGVNFMGCAFNPLDVNGFIRCLQGKVDKARRDAMRNLEKARKDFDKRLKDAQRQAQSSLIQARKVADSYKTRLADAQKNLKREVDKQVSSATRTLKSQVSGLRGQLDKAQRDAAMAAQNLAREASKSANLQKMLDRANAQVQQAADAIMVNAEWQKSLFTGLQQLPIGNLMNCLQRESLAGNLEFGPGLQQFAANPVGFVTMMANETISRATKEFGTLIQAELENMSTTGRLPDGQELVDNALDTIGVVVGQQGPAMCVFKEVRPWISKSAGPLADFARDAVEQMQSQAMIVVEKQILPALWKPAGDMLRQAFLGQGGVLGGGVQQRGLPGGLDKILLTEEELKDVARKVLFRRRVQKQFQMANASLTKLLDPGTGAGEMQAQLAGLQSLTQGTEDFEALYGALAIEVLRAMGHKYMNSTDPGHGGWLVLYAIALLQDGVNAIPNVINGACGVIPEAGAAVSAVVMQVIESVWNPAAIPVLESFLHQQTHVAVDLLADEALKMLEDGSNMKQIQGASNQLGPLAGLLRSIPHEQLLGAWTGELLRTEMVMFEEHFQKVHALAKKAAGE